MKSGRLTGRSFILILFPFLFAFLISFFDCTRSGRLEKDCFWKTGHSPEETGRLVIEDLLARPGFMMYRTDFWTGLHYAEACAGFGALRLAGLLKDAALLSELTARYSGVVEDGLVRDAAHVDANVAGILPLELYLQNRDEKHLNQGLDLADSQWQDPLPDGLTRQARFWIDDVWMIVSLQTQAWRATGKEVYLERAALTVHTYLEKLQQPNGLFHHGENAPFFWGRGNGWVAAGLAELLSELPSHHPLFPSVLNGYRKMMDALRRHQAGDGMWRQVIDRPDAWKETSSTAMFGYAVTVGVRKGLLPEAEFTPVYQKAWNALAERIDDSGRLTDVCAGTGKNADIRYYLDRPRNSGDLHGQAPVLWFAYSLMTEPAIRTGRSGDSI
ncbi:glycoside hydrolase family 88 protein [bacterium]|nr:glycoside hydrolase family 88 protein [bacterium]